jgi:hypothetical protein
MLSNLKAFCKQYEADIVLVVGVIFIAVFSFGGGWLMGNSEKNDINVEKVKVQEAIVSGEKKQIPSTSNQVSQNAPEKVVISAEQAEMNEINSEPDNLAKESTLVKSENITDQRCNFIGSKNSDIYHLPECSGAKRIKEENKKCFESKEEAEKAGYRPAQNCPGLN